MGEVVICLGCGGVTEGTPGADEQVCECLPPDDEAVALECPRCGGRLRIGARACPFCRSAVGTTRCGHCLAWNVSEAACCQSCGRSLAASTEAEPASLERAQERTSLCCPGCQSRLVRRRYVDWSIDECDSCGGVFVESGTLDGLLAAREAPDHGLRLALPKPSARPATRQEPRPAYLKCPDCGTLMTRRNFGGISRVMIDVCRGHGVWFDAGELSEVLAFVGRGGLDNPRARRRTFAVPEGAPKGSFVHELELRSYDGVEQGFRDVLEAIWEAVSDKR